MRFVLSSLLAVTLAAACGGRAPGVGSSPDDSLDASRDDSSDCDPGACLTTTIVIVGPSRSQTMSPCAAFSASEYNKGLNRSFACTTTIPACGDRSVAAINAALADPDVVAALRAAETSFVDPTFPETASGQFEIGPQPPNTVLPPSEAGPHGLFVGPTCTQTQCTAAPPGVVRLAHLLAGMETLCVPNEG